MGNLIFLIIVMWVVISKVKKQGQNKTVPNQPRRQQPVPNQSYRQPNATRPMANPNYTQQTSQMMAQAQQELKNRLQQKYGNRNSAYGTPYRPAQNRGTVQQSGDDILSRAKNNVNESSQDEIYEAMKPGMENPMAIPGFEPTRVNCAKPEDACTQGNQWHAHDIMEHGELLEQVNDLIVKGYSGNLTFERDFVAEGIEMLNRFELS